MNPLGVNIVSQMPKCLLDNLLKDSELGPMFEKIDRERFVHMMVRGLTNSVSIINPQPASRCC